MNELEALLTPPSKSTPLPLVLLSKVEHLSSLTFHIKFGNQDFVQFSLSDGFFGAVQKLADGDILCTRSSCMGRENWNIQGWITNFNFGFRWKYYAKALASNIIKKRGYHGLMKLDHNFAMLQDKQRTDLIAKISLYCFLGGCATNSLLDVRSSLIPLSMS